MAQGGYPNVIYLSQKIALVTVTATFPGITVLKNSRKDKYYVVDVGYPNTSGYLAPYKGTDICYHILDFCRGKTVASHAPRGPKEVFNYHHSSLRNVIERTFGVWKARWEILQHMHVNYTYETQVKIVLASMTIHNYIRKKDTCDEGFNKAQQESYTPNNGIDSRGSSDINEINEDTSTQRRIDDLYMSAVRDMIAVDLTKAR
ncbi:uncharacterized protein LOC110920435 [Helianthus annuus]|uniref:uncharacterized protein LOC110920435 n=1 Tax=Helianthus annuus TaxID=4232 RepID=UPI000B90282A|nr:uncharacterized protein LOC110920435 [Helianthus annuus]